MTITIFLIAITVGISWIAFNNDTLLRNLMMNPYLISTRKQYYRFLTSGFVHRDMTHLFFNMFSFYFFGTLIEHDFRTLFGELAIPYYIALYLIAIIVSDLPTYFKQIHNPSYNSLGASGGISAVIFVSIVLRPLNKIYLYGAIGIPGFVLGILYIGYSWYQAKQSRDSVNHDAHLYGALFGLVFCLVLYPASLVNFVEQIKGWRLF